MTLRGARILLAGACTEAGSSLVEAFLALGAHVVAADGLRTQLEELRARMRQHERLWVADCDVADTQAARALFADVARDEPIDAALLVLGRADRAGASASPDRAAAAQRCGSFLDAMLATMARGAGCGRVLVLLEAEPGAAERGAALVQDGLARARMLAPAVTVGGLIAGAAGSAWLERVMSLADPARPGLSGFEPAG